MERGYTVAYDGLGLRIYDLMVHWWNDNYVWRCPSSFLNEFFSANVGQRHLDIGVGTGYFPAHHRQRVLQKGESWPQHLTLVDMNTLCLERSAARVGCPERTTTLQADVFEPIKLPAEDGAGPGTTASRKYDSISLMYLLHCLPPPCAKKATVFAHLKEHLKPDGTLFGATILGQRVEHNWFGRITMGLYNYKGIFGNSADDPEVFKNELRNEFDDVDAWVVGAVLVFRARKPKLT
ncbi:class I SAM-dependent methyltransferase [Aspergillus melleus]|uniref:class I SAM-dependent methyltransferase n=1 Tax=Aspergillus melleus TaxID=138277 RepID=UPI001E8CEF69|nr:uncharacterized protein LDX57_010476 [Aspergillus melleus]KAH8432846.1 hypothetical protein LDX57_010476 [Aspergillus melleus]